MWLTSSAQGRSGQSRIQLGHASPGAYPVGQDIATGLHKSDRELLPRTLFCTILNVMERQQSIFGLEMPGCQVKIDRDCASILMSLYFQRVSMRPESPGARANIFNA